ncbi:MAG: DoxX family protein [Proteobacteria bacterium]|nr:DoxX family protein [Pseudomonadota bacterium]
MTTQTLAAPQTSKALHIGLWAVQGLLAAMFLMTGVMKLTTGQEELVAQGMAWAGRVPPELILFIGVSQLLGAIGLILPSVLRIKPVLTPIAAAALGLVMVLAAAEHSMAGEFSSVPVNAVLFSLTAFVAWGRGIQAPIHSR